MSNEKNNAAPDPQLAELAEQQGQVIVHALADAYTAGAEGLQFGGLARMEALAAALAATGNQQVGEVQGDTLDAVVEAICYDEHGIQVANVSPVVRERIRSALAARQPGAQVPYGFVLDWKHAPASFTTKAGVAAEHRDYKNCTVVPVYRAPPAQGIDLGQPRPLIARSLAEWHEDDGNVMWWAWCGRDWAGEPAWCGTPNDSDWPGYHTHWTQHPVQPALIDGQRDAAPGVRE